MSADLPSLCYPRSPSTRRETHREGAGAVRRWRSGRSIDDSSANFVWSIPRLRRRILRRRSTQSNIVFRSQGQYGAHSSFSRKIRERRIGSSNLKSFVHHAASRGSDRSFPPADLINIYHDMVHIQTPIFDFDHFSRNWEAAGAFPSPLSQECIIDELCRSKYREHVADGRMCSSRDAGESKFVLFRNFAILTVWQRSGVGSSFLGSPLDCWREGAIASRAQSVADSKLQSIRSSARFVCQSDGGSCDTDGGQAGSSTESEWAECGCVDDAGVSDYLSVFRLRLQTQR